MKPMSFNPDIGALLSEADLPTDDLMGTTKVALFGHEQNGRLVGLVGLEHHGGDALLRSLAVALPARGTGLGIELVAHAEHQALATGSKAVYLLTTTAAAFFARLGYNEVPRDQAPAAIASTSQFAGLCPDTAAFMVKRLDG